MKKILLFIFSIIMTSSILTACSPAPTNPSTPQPPQTPSYTVSFVNENGITLSTLSLQSGATPSYSYTVEDTAEWDYSFQGWSTSQNGTVLSSLPTVSANATYYAIVNKEKRSYTVSFEMNGATAIPSSLIEYGNIVSQPEDPKYDGHKFMGWYADEEGNEEFDWTAPITSNVTVYALWNEVVDVKSLLSSLLNGYKISPYSFIPEALQPNYDENLVDPSEVVTDYSNFVNVSQIPMGGFGEQWNVVVSNINQSMTFHNVLSVIDSISAISISAFNNYFDSNPQDTAHYSFEESQYNITINFDGEILSYVVDYTDTLPVLGEQTIQIAMSMGVESGEKTVRIQIGEPNAILYTIKENEYSFAIKYLGIRRAYLSLARDNNGYVSGHIYEYLTASGTDVEFESAVDFYIYDTYTAVVGNKASGIPLFDGYISEIYNNSTGKLIGYEIEETETKISSVTFNTLWFNLDAFDGFNSICYKIGTDEKNHFYVNGSQSPWENKLVGGFSLKTASRRFDIEFRKQYFYTYNTSTKEYEQIEAEIPMLFVQEEVMDHLVDDVEAVNNITISLNLNSSYLNLILDNYDELVPIFKENKDNCSSETIINMIGNVIVFD